MFKKLLFTLLFCTTLTVEAALPTVSLFKKDSDNFVNNYLSIIEKIKRGKNFRLIFEDGTVFQTEKFLDSGKTTTILKVKVERNGVPSLESYALRVPKIADPNWTQEFINLTIDTYGLLNFYNLPVTKIYQSKRNQYILVELIPTMIRGDHYFDDPLKIPEKIRIKARASLLTFAKRLALLSNMGDFRAEQFGYDIDRDEWLLFDWSKKPILAHNNGYPVEHLFRLTSFLFFYRELSNAKGIPYSQEAASYNNETLDLIDEAIRLERIHLKSSEPRCANLLFYLIKGDLK